jgi:hypothetical protein
MPVDGRNAINRQKNAFKLSAIFETNLLQNREK